MSVRCRAIRLIALVGAWYGTGSGSDRVNGARSLRSRYRTGALLPVHPIENHFKTAKIGAQNVSRPAHRLSNAAQRQRLHSRGRAHAGARHRGQHGDVQCAQHLSVSRATLSEFGPASERVSHFNTFAELAAFAGELLRSAREE